MMTKKNKHKIRLSKRIGFILFFVLFIVQNAGTGNKVFAEIPNDNPASFAVRRYVKKLEINRDIKYFSVLYLNSDDVPDIGYAGLWPNGTFGSGFCCAFSDGQTTNWPYTALNINVWDYYYYEKTGIVCAVSSQEEYYMRYDEPGEQNTTLFMKRGDIYYRLDKPGFYSSIPTVEFEQELRALTENKQRTKVNWMANSEASRNAYLREYAPYLFDIAEPVLLSISTPTSTSIRIEWGTVPNVTGYRVYKKKDNDSWTFLRDTKKTFLIDPFISQGNTYSYTVEAYISDNGKIFRSGYNPTGLTISIPALPTPTPVPNEKTTIVGCYNSAKGADLRWKKVNGATGYSIYRKRSSEGTQKLITLEGEESLQYLDTSIKDNCWGRVYTYFVCPMYETQEGPKSADVTLQRLAPMKLTKYVNTGKGKIDLQWTCSAGSNKAMGYELQYAASKSDLYNQKESFKKVTVNGRNNLKKTITGLIKGKTYYFRIRCYVNYTHSVTGKTTKTWSQYSDVVSAKVTR